jgi:hypothetical protein
VFDDNTDPLAFIQPFTAAYTATFVIDPSLGTVKDTDNATFTSMGGGILSAQLTINSHTIAFDVSQEADLESDNLLGGNHNAYSVGTSAINVSTPDFITSSELFFSVSNTLGVAGEISGTHLIGSEFTYFPPPSGALGSFSYIQDSKTLPESEYIKYAKGTLTVEKVSSVLADTPPSDAVPEPASWAFMIAGFGLTGAALRRRSVRGIFATA